MKLTTHSIGHIEYPDVKNKIQMYIAKTYESGHLREQHAKREKNRLLRMN